MVANRRKPMKCASPLGGSGACRTAAVSLRVLFSFVNSKTISDASPCEGGRGLEI